MVLIVLVAVELVITVSATWMYVASAGRISDEPDPTGSDTALVLGSLVSDGVPGDYVRGRLDTVLVLYRAGKIARIINSGNGSSDAGDEPAVMRDYLQQRGVAAGDIVDDPAGLDTDASCRRARDVFGVRRAVIITQDFHLRRAITLCRNRGVDATGVPAQCPCPVITVAVSYTHLTLPTTPYV